MLYNSINLSTKNLSIIQNFIMMNEIDLQKHLTMDTMTLDLSNPETFKLYKMNLELQSINNHVNFLIYKLVCLFNLLLSKKFDMQLFIK